MDASLTEDQELLRETAARLAEQLATTSADGAEHSDSDPWEPLVELGVPALRAPALAGTEATGVEVALVVEEFGRTLSLAPVVGQAVMVPELFVAAGADDLVATLAAGEVRLAPALAADLSGIAVAGEPAVAFDARGATHALAFAGPAERRLVALELRGDRTDSLDLTRTLVDVGVDAPVVELGDLGGVIDGPRWARAEALFLTAFAADLVGVMQGALDDVVTYVGQRRQFGVPVGSFQAVQHLAADVLVQLEGARSCCWYAAWALDHVDADAAMLAARVANGYASRAGLEVVEATVQMFGGIAITWEQLSHVRLRRTMLDRRIFGDESLQYAEVARLRLAHPELD